MPTTELAALEDEGTGSVADHSGKWVLVNVWASWCGPCRDEAPALQRFYERRAGDDFEIVGIDTQETAEAGRGFVEEFGLTYPQLHDGAASTRMSSRRRACRRTSSSTPRATWRSCRRGR